MIKGPIEITKFYNFKKPVKEIHSGDFWSGLTIGHEKNLQSLEIYGWGNKSAMNNAPIFSGGHQILGMDERSTQLKGMSEYGQDMECIDKYDLVSGSTSVQMFSKFSNYAII